MSPGLKLRVQHVAVNNDVEDAFRSVDGDGLANDVLVVGEKVGDRAHGVTRIVSTDAVLDADLVHGSLQRLAVRLMLVWPTDLRVALATEPTTASRRVGHW